jgi:hypothetical protein
LYQHFHESKVLWADSYQAAWHNLHLVGLNPVELVEACAWMRRNLFY